MKEIEGSFYNLILEKIKAREENETTDYKEFWYGDFISKDETTGELKISSKNKNKNKSLVEDILSMANSIYEEDSHIIIGANDRGVIVGVQNTKNRKTTEDITNLLNSLPFFGNELPDVTVKTLYIENKEVDVITIKSSTSTPFMLAGSYNGIKSYDIYSRYNSSNIKTSAHSVDKQLVDKLWAKRYGQLDWQTDSYRFKVFTNLRDRWEEVYPSEILKNECKDDECEDFEILNVLQYKNDISYQVVYIGDGSYFCKNPNDFLHSFEYINYYGHLKNIQRVNITLYKNNNFVESFEGIKFARDITAPYPKFESFRDEIVRNHLFSYNYFISGNLDYNLFFIDTSEYATMARHSLEDLIIFFYNEKEKERFDEFISKNKEEIKNINFANYASRINKDMLEDVTVSRESIIQEFGEGRFFKLLYEQWKIDEDFNKFSSITGN